MSFAGTVSFASNRTIKWRTLEWLGAGIALFVQTGAVTGYGSSRRFLLALSFLITALLLFRCRQQLDLALRRSQPFVILMLLPFVSVIWSISGSISLRRSIALLASLALAYVLAIRFTPKQLVSLVAWVLGPCMLISLFYAAALPHLGWMPGEGGMRGAFVNKNVLGWYASIGIVVSAGVVSGRDRGERPFGWLFLGASAICLVASGSMTGLLSTMAGLCLTIFYLGLTRLRGVGRTLYVLIVLQLLLVVMISTAELLTPTLEALGKDATLTGRVPLWALVDHEIGEHLLLGVGYQAFWTEANPDAWVIWSKIGWQAPHAHNGYRETLLNFGIVGMIVFLGAIFRAIGQGATLLCRSRRDGWLWLNVTVGMFLVMNLTESLFLVQNDFLFIFFATALLMFGLRRPESGALAGPDGSGNEDFPFRQMPDSRTYIDRKDRGDGGSAYPGAREIPK